MVNPGVFHGARKAYLESKMREYALAYDNGTLDDTLSNIIQSYFDLFPVDKGPLYEPTAEERAAIESGDPREEAVAPKRADMNTEAEYDEAMEAWNMRAALIKKTRAQIKRRLAYIHVKQYNITKKNTRGATNPFSFFAHQLAEKPLKRPRLLSALSIWRRSHRSEINEEARARCRKEGKSLKKALAPIREEIANAKFNRLSREARDVFVLQAEKDHDAAVEKWSADLKNPLSSDPESRQRCISNLPAVVQPLLDLIVEATGWKVTLIAGGPYPAHDGRMSMLSLHSGKTLGEIPMTFGRYEHEGYNKHIVPMFGRFMRKAFSIEECQESGLDIEDKDDIEATMPGLRDADTTGLQFQFIDDVGASRPCNDGDTSPPSSPPRFPTLSPPSSPDSRRSEGAFPVDFEGEAPVSPSLSRHSSPPPSRRSPYSPSPSRPTSTHSSLPLPLVPAPAIDLPVPAVSVPAVSVPPFFDPPLPDATAVSTPPLPDPTAVRSPPLPDPTAVRSPPLPDATPATPLASLTTTTLKRPGDQLEDVAQRKTSRTGVAVKGKGVKSATSKLGKKDTASNWFMDAMQLFTEGSVGLGDDGNGSLGDEWVDLVGSWSAFQRGVDDLALDSKLPTKNRPFVVKEWIARARSLRYRPKIANIGEFEREYRLWWASMQPTWRVEDGTVNVALVEGDWSSLRLPGMNGLLSVLAALFYWGCSVHGIKTKRAAWSRAVLDCHVALTHLTKADLCAATI